MQTLSIADRRKVMNLARYDGDFREKLQRDPRGTIGDATGRAIPQDMTVELVEEQPGAWSFVIPAGVIEPTLPPPSDFREWLEIDVYAALRDEPDVRDHIVSAPGAFLLQRFGIDPEGDVIDVRAEGADQLMIVLPHAETREELTDDLLDAIAGGGQMGCQTGKPPETTRPPMYP